MILSGNEIFIYDTIAADKEDSIAYGGISPDDWIAELHTLKDVRNILVRINSGGGSMFGGFAMHQAIRDFSRLGHSMTCIIDGLAASIASVIALAGDKVLMSDNALMMIHRPMNAVVGNTETMQKAIAVLEKANERLINIYRTKTGATAETVEKWLRDETWFSAPEALEAKLIDGILTQKTTSLDASIDLSTCTAPDEVKRKARQPIMDLLFELGTASRRIQEASGYEREHYANIAACAAERLLQKPGLRPSDYTIIEASWDRVKAARNGHDADRWRNFDN